LILLHGEPAAPEQMMMCKYFSENFPFRFFYKLILKTGKRGRARGPWLLEKAEGQKVSKMVSYSSNVFTTHATNGGQCCELQIKNSL
jgi:hypothetical protein